MIIAVDFDGTIVRDIFPNKPSSADILPFAKEVLWELHRKGHALVLWTLRDSSRFCQSRQMADAMDFLRENELAFLITPSQIVSEPTWKFPADLFIDDKVPGGFPGWRFIGKALGVLE